MTQSADGWTPAPSGRNASKRHLKVKCFSIQNTPAPKDKIKCNPEAPMILMDDARTVYLNR